MAAVADERREAGGILLENGEGDSPLLELSPISCPVSCSSLRADLCRLYLDDEEETVRTLLATPSDPLVKVRRRITAELEPSPELLTTSCCSTVRDDEGNAVGLACGDSKLDGAMAASSKERLTEDELVLDEEGMSTTDALRGK